MLRIRQMRGGFMGRAFGGDKQQGIELQPLEKFPGQMQMPPVDRIKCTSKNTQSFHTIAPSAWVKYSGRLWEGLSGIPLGSSGIK